MVKVYPSFMGIGPHRLRRHRDIPAQQAARALVGLIAGIGTERGRYLAQFDHHAFIAGARNAVPHAHRHRLLGEVQQLEGISASSMSGGNRMAPDKQA